MPASNSAPMKMTFLEISQSYDSINFNAFALVIAHCRKSRAVHMLLMACRVFGKRVKIFFDSTSAPNGDTKSQVIWVQCCSLVTLNLASNFLITLDSATNLFRRTPLDGSSLAGTIDRLTFTDSAVSLSKAAFSDFLFRFLFSPECDLSRVFAAATIRIPRGVLEIILQGWPGGRSITRNKSQSWFSSLQHENFLEVIEVSKQFTWNIDTCSEQLHLQLTDSLAS